MLPDTHPDVAYGKTGLLLVNLGTPDSPDAKGLRPYLKQFLSDKRVIEAPAFIWQPILRGIILNTRPRKSARAYAKIWDTETHESPLRRYTREQAEGLTKLFKKEKTNVLVAWAMRYGNPSIAEGLESLRAAGCTQISVISLYPQYSASTTASVNDEVFRCLLKMRWQPALRTAGPWHDHPSYIDALAKSVKKHISKLGWKPDYLVASFHGLPVAYFEKGDPYHCHCAKTARLLKEKLGMKDDNFKLTFQSRFGPTKWLEPYTEATLRELGEAGHKNIAVITPGFISDCVETLEEISIEARETFIDAGGENFTTIPCLNSSPESIKLLAQLAHAELAGWVA